MDIFFIRHATSIGNIEKILQGQMDYDLSEDGIKEAMKLKILLPKFDIIYSSPLSRCIQTMEISTGLNSQSNQVIIDDSLMELFKLESTAHSCGLKGMTILQGIMENSESKWINNEHVYECPTYFGMTISSWKPE